MAHAREVDCIGSAADYAQCVLCHHPGRSTKLLRCFHPVCETCLADPDIGASGQIKCEKCNTSTSVTILDDMGNMFCNLKPNPFQEIWANFEMLFEAKPCIMCSAQGKKILGTQLCLDCGEDYLCKPCLHVHATVGGTKHHEPVPITNLHDSVYTKKMQARHQKICIKHNTTMKFYCFVCETIVCNDCHQVEHLDHERIMMADFGDEQRQSFSRLKERLDQHYSYTTWQKAAFETLIEQSRVDEAVCVNEIAERVASFKTQLDEWERNKTEELRHFHQTCREQYKSNVAYWEAKGPALKSMSTYANLYLQYASDKDFKTVDGLKQSIESMLTPKKEEASPLIHKTLHFDWRDIENIEVTLDELIGSIYGKETLGVSSVNVIHLPTGHVLSGLSHTQEQDILVTASVLDGAYVLDTNGVAKDSLRFQDPIAAWNVVSHGNETFVSDCKLRQVKKLDKSGKTTHTIQLRGNKACDIEDRIGLTVDPQRDVMYISSAIKNTIYKCALDADVAEPLIKSHHRPYLKSPHYIHVTGKGDIVVTNFKAHKIYIYDPEGRIKRVVGEQGAGPEQFNEILDVNSDAYGYLYVADKLNHRVQVIAPDYSFVGSFLQGHEGFKEPRAMAVNRENDVFVTHSNSTISVVRLIRCVKAQIY